jgi:hypothetical protein
MCESIGARISANAKALAHEYRRTQIRTKSLVERSDDEGKQPKIGSQSAHRAGQAAG